MEKESLKQFDELEDIVSAEVKKIANKLMEEHETFEETIAALNDYYKSEFGLDDYVYSEIYKQMKRLATK